MRMSVEEFETLVKAKKLSVQVQGGFNLCNTDKGNVQSTKRDGTQEKKGNKYRNQKVYVYPCGMVLYEKDERLGKPIDVFDSVKEFERWTQLKKMEQLKFISSLRKQVNLLIQEPFEVKGEKIRAIEYRADFMYCDQEGNIIVEDVKGFDSVKQKYITTKDFQLKWKLLKYRYPNYKFVIV